MYSLFYAAELSEFLCAIVVRTQNCVQRYTKKLRYANYFCILHEISMKLQKTNTKKIEKTATRVAVFNLCDVSHLFNYVASCDTIWYTRVPNLILVLVYYLPMAAIAAANVFDMWQFSKTATDSLNTHMQ